MCGLHERHLGSVVEVKLRVECDVVVVHTTLPGFLETIYTGLEAVKTMSTLELFKHKVLRLEIFLIEIVQELNAKLGVTIESQVQIRGVLSAEPVWVLLTQVNLSPFLRVRSMQK